MDPIGTDDTSGINRRKKRVSKVSLLNEELDLSLFLLISKKRWKMLLSIFLVIMTLATVYLRYAQRNYEESCVIQVGSQNTANKVLQQTANLYNNGGEDEVAQAVEVMRSRIFLEKVFRQLPLNISYYTEGAFKDDEKYLTSPYRVEVDSAARKKLAKTRIYVHFTSLAGGKISYSLKQGPKNTFTFYSGQWCETPRGKVKIDVVLPLELPISSRNINKDADFFLVNDYNDLTKYYSKQITVKPLDVEAKTIMITCHDNDDTKAANIVNEIGRQYINETLRKRRESDENILSFLNQQLDTLFNRMRETEQILGDTIKKNHVSAQPMELTTSNSTYLSFLDDKISSLEIEQKMLSEYGKRITNEKDVDPNDLAMQLSLIDETGSLKDNIEILRGYMNQRESVTFDATDANTKVQELDTLITQQKKLIIRSIGLLTQKMESTRKDYEAQRDKVESTFVTPGTVAGIENLRLQRQANIDEKHYDLLLEKKAEYEISKAGYVPESEILENAIPIWSPVSPKKSVTFIVAILLSSAIGLIILVLVYVFYNNITSIQEIEKLAESPVTILGIIPKYTKEIPASQIIVNYNPKSVLAEAFRSIRTNLQFISNDVGPKIIAITSTISGEGKTFVCMNLGGIIAYSGKKVIILDVDMRRPRIHTAFGLNNLKGMSTLLIGKYSIEEVIQKTESENLDIITAGPIPPNPSELVIGKSMDTILAKLKTMYDIIIIDNPPVGLVTDGIAMLQKADYPIYMMRVDYSKREFIYFVDKLYFENQFHKLSIVLNGVDFQRKKYGYNYYKYGYYGYGYSYGQGNYYET